MRFERAELDDRPKPGHRIRIQLCVHPPLLNWAEQLEQCLVGHSELELKTYNSTTTCDLCRGRKPCQDIDALVWAVSLDQVANQCAALAGLRRSGLCCPVLMLTDIEDEISFRQLINAGATDFITLPLRHSEVLARLARWCGGGHDTASADEGGGEQQAFAQIIGRSTAIRAQVDKARHFAGCNGTVLLTGETGTGKEVFARAIHYASQRSTGLFVPVNCAALPPELLENELFGHVGGAFTGAQRLHKGLVEKANRGTLFLDEVDSLSPVAQAKLLRFLQEQEYRPLGAAENLHADLRMIAGANVDLKLGVRTGSFRQDLYFRLNILSLELPALRYRRGDIPLLASHLLRRHAKLGRCVIGFTPQALSKLEAHDWPGNVREMENVIQRAILLARGPLLEEADLDVPDEEPIAPDHCFRSQKAHVIEEFERGYLVAALARHGGNISEAAREAGKDRRAFFELIRKHHLTKHSNRHLETGLARC